MGAVGDGRWPGRSVTIAALAEPPSAYHHLLKSHNSNNIHYLDCFTNPYGWPTPALLGKQQSNPQQQLPVTALHLFQTSSKRGLDELLQRVLAQPKTLLFIDTISPLVDTFGLSAICSFLNTLKNNGAGVVFMLHSDLHSQHEVATLCYGAACLVELIPANERPEQYIQPHGRVSMRFKRKSGAVKTEKLDYRINNISATSRVEFLPSVATSSSVSSNTTTPSVVAKAAGAPSATASTATTTTTTSAKSAAESRGGSGVVNVLGQQLAGGMRLDVSAEEAAARSQVQLPYEHQGQGQLYASGGDFRDYLPEAAGGRRRGTGRLGHILYVRDSDSEDPDSDEDPDDDLDV